MRSWAVFFPLLYLNTNVQIMSVKIKTFDPPLRTEGIFKNFLRHFFDTLLDFPSIHGPSQGLQGLSPYLYILSRCVGEMGYRQTNRLARVIKRLSEAHELDIRDALGHFKEDLELKVRWRAKFLKAMNAIFTSEQSLLFHDYIRELKRYGKNERRDIVEDTRVLLNYVILNRVTRLRDRDRRHLKKMLSKATKEYNVWSIPTSPVHSVEPAETSSDVSSDSSSEYLKLIHKNMKPTKTDSWPIQNGSYSIIAVLK